MGFRQYRTAAAGRGRLTSRPSSSASSTTGGGVEFTQGKTTIKLSVTMPDQGAKGPTKLSYFNEAWRTVIGTTLDDGDKRQLLIQTFHEVGATASAQVDTALTSFHDLSSSVAPQLTNPAAFVLSDLRFLRSTGTQVQLQQNPRRNQVGWRSYRQWWYMRRWRMAQMHDEQPCTGRWRQPLCRSG